MACLEAVLARVKSQPAQAAGALAAMTASSVLGCRSGAVPTDLSHAWVSTHDPPARRIVRQISNTFWFFREVFRYGEDCLIVAPDVVKTRFKQKLLSLCRSYGLLDVAAE